MRWKLLSRMGACVYALTALVGAAPFPATAAVVGTPTSEALVYTAGAGETNDLTVSTDGSNTVVFVDPAAVISSEGECTSLGPHQARCPRRLHISADLGDGNDRATVTDSLVPECGSSSPYVDSFRMFGGIGNDVLRGGPGADYFFDDAGASDGRDAFFGGSGWDCIAYAGPAVISLDGEPNDGVPDEQDNVGGDIEQAIAIGSGNLTFFGNAEANGFSGGPGRDVAYGRGGDDRLHGGWGPDRLFGDAGNDTVTGSNGRDTLSGGRGRDAIYGGLNADHLRGGSGFDRLDGGFAQDVLCSRDGERDRLTDFGRNIDTAYVDPRLDRVSGIERVFRDRPCPS